LNSVGQRSISRQSNIGGLINYAEAYPLMNSIEINTAFTGGTYKLWYQKRPIELHAGTATAGGVSNLTLQADRGADVRDDYYNGASIDIVGGSVSGRYLISDYVGSTRVITLSTTATFSTYTYGIIPITPPECNNLIILEATLLALAKPSSVLDKEILQLYVALHKAEQKEISQWLETRLIENTGVTIGDL
jgi:hypothetical protein